MSLATKSRDAWRQLRKRRRNTEWLCSQEGRQSNGWARCSMSAIGTKQTFISTLNMSAFEGKADIPDAHSNVR